VDICGLQLRVTIYVTATNLYIFCHAYSLAKQGEDLDFIEGHALVLGINNFCQFFFVHP
jgi:hypothetical protein